ncbi:WD domain, G-beta repeat [Planctomycetes bacterium Pan216]|uniref:WD domain, G-beta repeat n=1 Tax=Kolteria novifilia TaxID=2527975 RepID=A0A518AZ11_9BACT|nr:WD domain, G-beta repeat [Planctomycetes bacterium Pan216]
MMRIRAALLVVLSALVAPQAKTEEPRVSFTKEIAPIFVEHCLGCHDSTTTEGNVDMSRFSGLFMSTKGEAMIVPGEPYESQLLLLMYGDDEPVMPQEADLLDEKVVAKVEKWIKQGAKFDGPDANVTLRSLLPESVAPVATNYTQPPIISSLTFSPDGKQLAAAGFHEITFWDPASGKLLRRLPTKGEKVQAIAFSPDGELLAHAGGTPGRMGEVCLWDAKTLSPLKTIYEAPDMVYALAFGPDGKTLAAGDTERKLSVWEIPSGKALTSEEIHADWILDLAFAPDGKQIYSASRDKTSKIWDLTKKQVIASFAKHQDGLQHVVSFPDGKRVATAGDDKTIKLWEPNEKVKQLRTIGGHKDDVFALVVSKDGKRLYSAGADQKIHIWDPNNGKRLQLLTGHGDWINSLALSPDGKWLFSGDSAGEIFCWDLSTGKPIRHFQAIPAVATASLAKEKSPKKAKPKGG